MNKAIDAQNAACNAVVQLVDQGTLYSSGSLSIFDASSSLIANFVLSNPAFLPAIDGTAISNYITDSTSLIDGTAFSFNVFDRDASVVWSGTVTDFAGTGDLKLNSISIPQDSSISLTQIVYSVPEYFVNIGNQGCTGVQGYTGVQGVLGLTGVQGIQGPYGFGFQGETGVQGPNGNQGFTGVQGPVGFGFQGETGVQGDSGLTGVQGLQGSAGNQGVTGVSGQTGFQGTTGIQGVTGVSQYFPDIVDNVNGLSLQADGGRVSVNLYATGEAQPGDLLILSAENGISTTGCPIIGNFGSSTSGTYQSSDLAIYSIANGNFSNYTIIFQDTTTAGGESIVWGDSSVVFNIQGGVSTPDQLLTAAGGIYGTPWATLESIGSLPLNDWSGTFNQLNEFQTGFINTELNMNMGPLTRGAATLQTPLCSLTLSDGTATLSALNVCLPNLPTTPFGLPSGTLWKHDGTLMIS